MHSFAPIQKNFKIKDLMNCDSQLINTVSKTCGFSNTDAKHLLFISEKNGGHGIKTFQEVDLVANARELEVILNGCEFDGKAIRSRTAAIKNRLSLFLGTNNHIWDAIKKLAKFGFFLRDRNDGIINRILDNLAQTKGWKPVGDKNFQGSSGALLGEGNLELTQAALGSTWYSTVKNFLKGIWNENQSKYMVGSTGFQIIKSCHNSAKEQTIKDFTSMKSFKEWSVKLNPYIKSNPLCKNQWEMHNINNLICNSLPDLEVLDNWNTEDEWTHCINKIRINPMACLQWTRNNSFYAKNNRGAALLRILNSKSPLIIATDGGHETIEDDTPITSAAITICILDIRENETLSTREWEKREVIPILIGSCRLPNQIGAHNSDNNQGEALALCMQEEILPLKKITRCIVMDSSVVRNRFLTLRSKNEIRDRIKIRHILPGVGKGIMSRLMVSINEWKNWDNIENGFIKSHHEPYKNMCREMMNRHKEFIELLHSSRQNDEELRKLWKEEYLDNHSFKSVIKVDSHQLCNLGKSIKSEGIRRYERLVPNLALLNANHWADHAASCVIRDTKLKTPNNKNKRNSKKNHNGVGKVNSDNHNILYTNNELRFFFTWNGKMIDKNTCQFLNFQLEENRINNLQCREAQGMLSRIIRHTTTNPRDIPYKSGWRRIILYLTNTHTRSSYKNLDYNKAASCFILNSLLAKEEGEILDSKYLQSLKLESSLLQRCTWCNMHWNDFGKITDRILSGNRRHIFLLCENKDLAAFRSFMRLLIENMLVNFHNNMKDTAGIMGANNWLYKIQNVLLDLQSKNIGRICNEKRESASIIINYLPIKGWINRLQINSIEEGIHEKIDILSHIIGLRHALGDGELLECESGVVDYIFLGLIPKRMQTCIKDICKDAVNSIFEGGERRSAKEELLQQWEDIVKLIRLQNIGIHRISSNIAKEKKDEWLKTFNITSIKKIRREEKKEAKRKATDTSDEEDDDSTINSDPKRKKINSHRKPKEANKPVTPSPPTKITFNNCEGIKCKFQERIWDNSLCGFIKKMKEGQKICQTCLKLTNAVRKFNDIAKLFLYQINDTQRSAQIKETCQKLYTLRMQSRKVKTLDKLLKDLDANSNIHLCNKKGIATDNAKQVIRILSHVINSDSPSICSDSFLDRFLPKYNSSEKDIASNNDPTNANFDWNAVWNNLNKAVLVWSNALDGVLPIKKSLKSSITPNSSSGIKPSKKPSTVHISKPDAIVKRLFVQVENAKDIKPGPHNKRTIINLIDNTKKVNRKLKKSRLQYNPTKEISCSNQLLTDQGADRILDIIRISCTNSKFVACAFSSGILNLGPCTEWIELGRLFRNNAARRKDNGIYMIPSFMGTTNCGHWYLNIVWWHNNTGQGYTLDSLQHNNSTEKENNKERIIRTFGTDNITSWEEICCKAQTELECGPRMLLGVLLLSNCPFNFPNFLEVINRIAQLTDFDPRNHATEIRRKLAELSSGHCIRTPEPDDNRIINIV